MSFRKLTLAAAGLALATLAVPIAHAQVASPGCSPHTGMWSDRNQPGRGFAIEIGCDTRVNDRLAFAGFLYRNNGDPTWWYSTGSLDANGNYSGTLQEFANGQPLGGAYKSPTLTGLPGTVTITFTSDQSATMVWPGGTTSITRYVFANPPGPNSSTFNSPTNGFFVPLNPDRTAASGSGLFVETQDQSAFLAFFHYDAVTGVPAWYVGQGPTSFNANYVYTINMVPLLKCRDGQTLDNHYPAAVTPNCSNPASVSAVFDQNGHAILTLSTGERIEFGKLRI